MTLWTTGAARRLRPSLPTACLLTLVTLLLSSCALFGNVGAPTDAHNAFAPTSVLPHATTNLAIKVFPKPLPHPQYTVVIYHNVNTVGEFAPEILTVPVGATVQWVWTDQYDEHNVWWVDQNLPNSPTMGSGYKWAVQFLKPGQYDYYCTLHPGMIGRVTVTG